MTNRSKVIEIKSAAVYQKQLLQAQQKRPLAVLNFWASWAQPCAQMNDVFADLSAKYGDIMDFLQVEAEEITDLSEKFEITAVPCFIVIQKSGSGNEIERIDGANPPVLVQHIEKHAKHSSLFTVLPTVEGSSGKEDPQQMGEEERLNLRLKALTSMAHVVLFMKGNPEQPKCGFSRQMIDILTSLNAKFKHFDILTDDAVRQGLKKYADWPTYPQLWIDGELVGGLDITKEMVASSELQPMLSTPEQSQTLNDRLTSLINKAPVMIFIKGSPDAPQCGFSRQLIEILHDLEVKFDYFDILSDDTVRQGLKSFSDWPTYPQVYVKGELVGGLDIVRELVESGEFEQMLA